MTQLRFVFHVSCLSEKVEEGANIHGFCVNPRYLAGMSTNKHLKDAAAKLARVSRHEDPLRFEPVRFQLAQTELALSRRKNWSECSTVTLKLRLGSETFVSIISFPTESSDAQNLRENNHV